MTLAGLISGFVRRHWAAYAASALMLLGVALLTVWLPRQVGLLVDGLVAQRLTREALAIELLKLLAAGAAIYGLRVGWRLKLYAAAYRLGVELRERLYRRLTLQGPPFFQQRRTGDLMANATNDIDAIELAAGEAMLAGFDGSLTLLLVVAAMALVIDPWLALVAMLPFPPMALAFWWISRHLHDASRDALDCFSRLNDHAQETLSGVRTLRALGLEQRSSTRFAELADAAAKASERAQRWEATYEPAVGISLTLAVVLTLGYGGWRVWQGELTIGELTSFNLYLGQLIWPMFAAGWVLSLLGRGRAAWGRLQPVLDAPLTLLDEGRGEPQSGAPIRAEQLRFAYPGQARPALDGVSFELPAGRTLGLVGPTGAGKSSVLKLLLRQWDPQSGQLHWGDAALPSLSLRALRDAVAWVPQEAFLFSASVAQNIALARPEASRAEIEQAARLAALDEDIQRLPQGYDTPVGERGVTLSGGQRQRVAIARALLADRPLLLLDDALSAVDTLTESRILAHLREQRVGRSVIIVSHRLSTVMDADQTLVLQHGHVLERGTHAELLARGGWYATQWQYQQLEQQLEGLAAAQEHADA
jgi:ATP-binding cassette, subfamily B, multidrug efflux pump